MFDTLSDGDVLLGDRVYDSDTLRIEMAARGVWADIKPMPNRKPTLPSAHSSTGIATRRTFLQKINQFRAVATRYDKRNDNLLAQSNSHRSASGCAIMSRRPNASRGRLLDDQTSQARRAFRLRL